MWPVVFRKGPLGFLLQDPSPEAKKTKNDPSLCDKSDPKREDAVRENALSVVRQRGGDVTDALEVLGDYSLQFGKYKGKCFRWLLENDVGYTIYIIRNRQKEEEAGICLTESLPKVNLLTFVKYALSFKEIQDVLDYETNRGTSATTSEDDQLVGFGSRAKSTWKEIWDTREDGYTDFILKKSCLPGTRMKKLQQYLLQKTLSSCPPKIKTSLPHKPLGMEEDDELEAAMLSISPSKLLRSAEKEGTPVPKPCSRAKTVPVTISLFATVTLHAKGL
ncbi:uncharacterized protein LOC119780223 [Cyprinodon tularosa]|uniref:uncharacterized protein LOC119780223 n=1 Tax=Cyprinodon tularosa TaxID=77115 RepID=UPI0018E26249|nr:uncharacterized protein LOC119780223 [Cyprinodon tularosa]